MEQKDFETIKNDMRELVLTLDLDKLSELCNIDEFRKYAQDVLEIAEEDIMVYYFVYDNMYGIYARYSEEMSSEDFFKILEDTCKIGYDVVFNKYCEEYRTKIVLEKNISISVNITYKHQNIYIRYKGKSKYADVNSWTPALLYFEYIRCHRLENGEAYKSCYGLE